jgi:hypothetical protein
MFISITKVHIWAKTDLGSLQENRNFERWIYDNETNFPGGARVQRLEKRNLYWADKKPTLWLSCVKLSKLTVAWGWKISNKNGNRWITFQVKYTYVF